jgi:hypothetical protein
MQAQHAPVLQRPGTHALVTRSAHPFLNRYDLVQAYQSLVRALRSLSKTPIQFSGSQAGNTTRGHRSQDVGRAEGDTGYAAGEDSMVYCPFSWIIRAP